MRILLVCIIAGLSLGALAQDDGVEAKIKAAMAADIRTEADLARDRNRKPVETLAFFQLSDDMRVLELLPGGGWYTKLLAPVLRDNGELYVAIGTNNVQQNLVPQPGFDHINIIDIGVELERTGPFGTRDMASFGFGVSDIDLAVTFRNIHNFTAEARAKLNSAVFTALRSGGLYGVIDHTLRHMEPMTRENRRRVDVVQIIKEIQDAGFKFVDYSDLHYRPDDELRYEVGRATVTGNTDRFTLLFRKP
ncbi:MAG: class I SAM-dependent methyltransferase [Proteobacteria bacterium]|nr:class I SAM-dependent methyltransferase [Pseudomonadota bacterium]